MDEWRSLGELSPGRGFLGADIIWRYRNAVGRSNHCSDCPYSGNVPTSVLSSLFDWMDGRKGPEEGPQARKL